MYNYKATVVRVVDGDTVYLDVDLGFMTRRIIDVRLKGIDTPEIRGASREAGLKAKSFTEQALPPGATVMVNTYKAEKYGRFLADIWYLPGTADLKQIQEMGRHLNQELLDHGLAVPYMAD